MWGPGVNLSQRVEQLAEPGGVCVSGTVFDAVSKSLPIDYDDLGEQQVKDSVFHAYRARLHQDAQISPRASGGAESFAEQDIRFCRTSDNVRIAWSSYGDGKPLVRVLNWATHLEWEWQNSRGRHLIDLMSAHFNYVRYDARHVGLSERRSNSSLCFDERYADLCAVVDATGQDKVALLGCSEGGATALAYAARNPERVSHLVLLGAANLQPISDEALDGLDWMPYVLKKCWGQDYVQAKRVLAALFGLDEEPNGPEDMVAFCRQSMKAADASNIMHQMLRTTREADVLSLAEAVKAPTLILHSRDDVLVPSTNSQYIASYIQGARLKFIESRNHVMGFISGYDELIVSELREFMR
jgi:pimeloyl-ACP methyl ester carboxylesterase